MYLSNLILLLVASQAFADTGSTTATDVNTNTNLLPTTTHAFEVLTTTTFVDGANPGIHDIDGNQLSPRDVCGKAIYVGEAVSFLMINCPDTAYCATPTNCFCPGCCPTGAMCTGCPASSVFMAAGGKLTTTCKTAETVVVVTGKAREAVPRTLSLPEASMTASLTKPTSPLPVSQSLPTASASSSQGQAALQRGVVQPFAWLGRLASSLSVRLTQALPVKMRENSAAGRGFGNSLQSENPPPTGPQTAVQTPSPSGPDRGHTHRERSIGDHHYSHHHLHRHLAARDLNTTSSTSTSSRSRSSILPVSFTATAWFTTTSTSTTTVVITQAVAETTKTCDLRRKRDF